MVGTSGLVLKVTSGTASNQTTVTPPVGSDPLSFFGGTGVEDTTAYPTTIALSNFLDSDPPGGADYYLGTTWQSMATEPHFPPCRTSGAVVPSGQITLKVLASPGEGQALVDIDIVSDTQVSFESVENDDQVDVPESGSASATGTLSYNAGSSGQGSIATSASVSGTATETETEYAEQEKDLELDGVPIRATIQLATASAPRPRRTIRMSTIASTSLFPTNPPPSR